MERNRMEADQSEYCTYLKHVQSRSKDLVFFLTFRNGNENEKYPNIWFTQRTAPIIIMQIMVVSYLILCIFTKYLDLFRCFCNISFWYADQHGQGPKQTGSMMNASKWCRACIAIAMLPTMIMYWIFVVAQKMCKFAIHSEELISDSRESIIKCNERKYPNIYVFVCYSNFVFVQINYDYDTTIPAKNASLSILLKIRHLILAGSLNSFIKYILISVFINNHPFIIFSHLPLADYKFECCCCRCCW